MDVILNSGHVVKDVELLDRTKNPVGLLVWAQKQHYDPILTFNKLSVKASQVAGIEYTEFEQSKYSYNNNNKQHIEVRDEDMPWNNNQFKGNQY